MLRYGSLAAHLGADQPFYALQARGFRRGETPLERIEDMAAQYLAEMRGVQPAGPYYLGGMCVGGMIAFEMACRLRAADEEVGLLALLDSAFGRPRSNGHGPCYYLKRAFHHLRDGRLIEVAARARAQWTRRRQREAGRARRLADSEAMEPHLRRLTRVRIANGRARDAYVHGRYAGRLVYIRSSALPSLSVPAWEQVADGGVAVFEVAGDHTTLMEEPAVAEVAACIRRCMDGTAG